MSETSLRRQTESKLILEQLISLIGALEKVSSRKNVNFIYDFKSNLANIGVRICIFFNFNFYHFMKPTRSAGNRMM
jgi:hypothetical protein